MVSQNGTAPMGQGGATATGRWRYSRRRTIPVAVAVSLGVLLSITGWFVTAHFWEDRLAVSELGMVGENRVLAIDTAFENQIKLIDDLRGYFGSLGGIPRHDEFEAVTAHLAGQEQHPVSITWVAHVRDQDRASFESQIRADQPGFAIRDRQPDGTVVAAAQRPEYYPVLFAGGLNGTTPGVDLGTDGVLLDTVRQAGTLARTTATPVRTEGPNGGWVISIVSPLFQRGSASNGLSGFILGTFDLGAVVKSVPHSVVAFHGVDTYLFDQSKGADAAPLYIRSSVLHTNPAPIRSRAALESGRHWSSDVTVADYRLAMVVVPVAGGPLDPWHLRAWSILLLLLLCTAAIAAALAKSARHAHDLEINVANLRRRDAVLQAVAASGAELVGTLDFQQGTATTLALVGRATGVDRVHLVRRTLPAAAAAPWDQQLWSAAQEVTANPVPDTDGSQLGDDVLQPVLGRQMQGGAIVVDAQQETGTLRTALDRAKIRSMLVIPALLTQNSQCLLVFVLCGTEQRWSAAESALLKVVADLLGGALARHSALAQLADADQIIENSSTMLFRAKAEPGWPLVYVSDNVARYGYSAVELCAAGRKFEEFIHPDDLPDVRANLARAIDAGRSATEIVCRERPADGNYRWFETKITIHRDSADLVKSISGIMLDVTERKQAEDALAFSHLLLAASLENGPDAVLITDEHDSSITNNRRFSELWNIPQDLLATGLDDKAIAAAAALVKEPVEFVARIQYVNVHRDERTQDELAFKDGRFFERRTAPLADPAGRYLGRIWLFRDITERKQAQDALAFSHVLLTAALENSPDGILIIDQHDRAIMNNTHFLELWNLPQAVSSVGFDERTIEFRAALFKDPEAYRARVRHIFAHRDERAKDELEFKDGRFFERHTAPLYDDERRYLGRIFVLRDITGRKRAQDALEFSHVLLTAALEQSPDGIVINDEHSRVIVSNPLFAKLWNVPGAMVKAGLDEEGLAARAAQLKDPEGFIASVRHIYGHRDERTREELEFKDGRFFERTSAPLSDSKGHHLGRIWVWHDITERKLAQQALAFSNTLLTAAMQSSPEGMLVVDARGHVVAANDRILEIIKLPPELAATGDHQPLLAHFATLVENPEQFLDRVKHLYAHPEEQGHDRIAAKDGRILDRHTTSLYDSLHQYLGRIWFFRDITKRKLAEQALIFSNTLLTAAMNSSPYGMLVIDPQSRILSFNDRFIEIFKVPPQLASVTRHEKVLAHVSALVKSSEQFLQRVRYISEHPDEHTRDQFELKDGRTVDRHTAPLYDDRHRHLGLICFFRDLSEPGHTEQAGLAESDVDGLADRLSKSQVADEAREALRKRTKPPAIKA